MAPLVATHDGPFHADDVTAVALIRTFWHPEAAVVRTRDLQRIAEADVVVDVGGEHDPARRRFDHHQHTYTGPLSSAGMVLAWLEAEGNVAPDLAAQLREGFVDYLDAVDNGREAPRANVLCLPRMVDALNQPARTPEAFDRAFLGAVELVQRVVEGLVAGFRRTKEDEGVVVAAMAEAVRAGRRVLFFDDYVKWQEPYFAHGGAEHFTEFVLFPGIDGTWRAVAIPPTLGSFAQKRPFPEAWAGLTNEALEAVTGVPGSVFCHKNRFIAVFKTREAAVRALEAHGLMGGEVHRRSVEKRG